MARRQTVQPPSVAAWLVDLFVIEEQAGTQEQILDKFSEMALRCGTGPARRWYWRQSANSITGLIGTGFRTAPWLIVGTALGGALPLQMCTSSLQREITAILHPLNHHVRPYYDSKGASRYFLWLKNTVLIGSLIESQIVGGLVGVAAKRREMMAAMTLSFVSLVMTATIFWVLVSIHKPVNPVLFPKIMIEQLSSLFMITIGGIIVREMRSAATRGLSGA